MVCQTQPKTSGLLLRHQMGHIQAMFEHLCTLLRSPGWFGGAEVNYLPSQDAQPCGKHRRDLLGCTAPALPSHLPGGAGEWHLLPCSLWLLLPPSRLQHSQGSTPGHPAGTQEGGDPCRKPRPRDRESIWPPASPWFSLGTVSPTLSITVVGWTMGPSTLLGAPRPLGSCRQGSLPSCSPDVQEGAFAGTPLLSSSAAHPRKVSTSPALGTGGCLCPTPRM